jgi:hypothetical protein
MINMHTSQHRPSARNQQLGKLRTTTIAAVAGSLVFSSPAAANTGEPAADTTAPVVSTTGLAPGQLVSALETFRPAFTDDVGVVRVQVLLNGKLNYDTPIRPTWNGWVRMDADAARLANDTDADVTIRVLDAAGNAGEATTRVHVDTIRPTATVTPVARTSLRSGPVTITLSDVPDDVVQIAMHDVDSRLELAKLTSEPWTFTWNATPGTNHAFWLRDRAGNINSVVPDYIVDDDAPVIRHLTSGGPYTPELVIGPSGGTVGGNGHVALNAVVDDVSPLTRIEWWADGTLRSTGSLLGKWETRTNGPSTVELRVWDAAGHTSTATFPITIDNTGPTVTAVTPANGTLVRGTTIRTTINASDPNGIGHVNVAGLRSDNGTTQYVPAGRDGQRTFTWHVIDRFGNQTHANRTVIVDNTAPAVTLTKAPKDKTRLTKAVRLTASAADRNGIARVQLLVNGKVVATDYGTGYSYTLNPKKYGKKFTIRLRAYDKAGNVKYTTTRTYRR